MVSCHKKPNCLGLLLLCFWIIDCAKALVCAGVAFMGIIQLAWVVAIWLHDLCSPPVLQWCVAGFCLPGCCSP
jgi:hypothetical protein